MILVRLNHACPVPFYRCEVEDGVGKCNRHSKAEAQLRPGERLVLKWAVLVVTFGLNKPRESERERSEGVRGSVFTQYPCLESQGRFLLKPWIHTCMHMHRHTHKNAHVYACTHTHIHMNPYNSNSNFKNEKGLPVCRIVDLHTS